MSKTCCFYLHPASTSDDTFRVRPSLKPRDKAPSLHSGFGVAFPHVLVHRPVLSGNTVHSGGGAYSDPVVEDLHHAARDADVHLLLDVLVAYAVEIPLHLDVVVEGDGRLLPHGDFEGSRRQGEKEIPLFLQKDAPSASGALLEWTLVQFLQFLPDLAVEFRHREKGPVPEGRHDPVDMADRSFHAGLSLAAVPRRSMPFLVTPHSW